MSLESGVYLVEKTIDQATLKRSIERSDRVRRDAVVSGKTITISKKSINNLGRVGRDAVVSEISSIITSEEQLEPEEIKRTSATLHDCSENPVIKLYYGMDGYVRKKNEGEIKRIASFEMIKEGSVSLARYRKADFIESYFVPIQYGYKLIRNRLKENTDRCWKIKGTRDDVYAESGNYKIFLNANNFFIIQTRIDTEGLPMATEIAGHATKLILKPETTTPDFNKSVYDALVETYERLNWLFFFKIEKYNNVYK